MALIRLTTDTVSQLNLKYFKTKDQFEKKIYKIFEVFKSKDQSVDYNMDQEFSSESDINPSDDKSWKPSSNSVSQIFFQEFSSNLEKSMPTSKPIGTFKFPMGNFLLIRNGVES